MPVGDRIGKYRLLTEWSTAGGGTCQWAKAGDQDSNAVFLKKFLSPTYPKPDGPGGEASKAKKRERCDRFERHHRELTKRIKGVAKPGGTLAVQIDFFRDGAHYYKVTEWIDDAGGDPVDVAALPQEKRLLILVTAAKSVQVIHAAGIVHGDLKPTNIMIRRTTSGSFAAKLIDFDSSYLAGAPPERDDIVGDFVYYSPELLRYVKGDEAVRATELTTASDVFALGLIVHQYLVGEFPRFDRDRASTAADAVVSGTGLEIAEKGLGAPFRELLIAMFDADPSRRPPMMKVHEQLKRIRQKGSTPITLRPADETRIAPPVRAPERVDERPTRLKGKGLKASTSREAADSSVPDPTAEEPPIAARIKIRGLRTDDDE